MIRVLLSLGLAFAAQAEPVTYSNPVLAGDYPDPSVVRVGNEYWATATSSEWGPQFPLLHSKDLVNWQQVGSVFSERPAWSSMNYWAPEITEWKGHFLIYYTARKTGAQLCVCVATADQPAGPWTDHGPIIAQEVGSIDGVPFTDKDGQRWLAWKEDGNSRKLPSPLWMQRLDDTGTRLIGKGHQLIRNDTAWERDLIEGPFMLHRGDWYYLFYSGSDCCGADCDYAFGVARSRSLTGPWEKHPQNPILGSNKAWKCPGHGSIITDAQGRYWLLYHAYDTRSFVYTGREMMLDEVTFSHDGWPQINQGKGPSLTAPSPVGTAQTRAEMQDADAFDDKELSPGWQWPQGNKPQTDLSAGQLKLTVTSTHADALTGAVLGRNPRGGNYTASITLLPHLITEGSSAGITAFGDEKHAIGLCLSGSELKLWERHLGKTKSSDIELGKMGDRLHLRVEAVEGSLFLFSYSMDGQTWQSAGSPIKPADINPWDRSLRIGITCGGPTGSSAVFDDFIMTTKRTTATSP